MWTFIGIRITKLDNILILSVVTLKGFLCESVCTGYIQGIYVFRFAGDGEIYEEAGAIYLLKLASTKCGF